jgi:DNA primase
MAYPPELIQQIRDANDIVGVVQQWVPLKKAGGNYKGLCPFHNEKSPSFNVHPAKQIYHCFGCGEGGDVFSFVQKMSKIGFGETVKMLAERAGVELPEDRRDDNQREQEEAQRRELERLGQLLDLAAVWFRRHLEESEEAAPARAYAEKRGLDAETREKFQLGWAPADGRALSAAAKKKGFDDAALDKAGLMSKGERGIYSRFRARLMFPIQDPKGRLAGFGGRIVGEGEPKYLNSGEGPLFNKSKLLYPWPQAKDALAKIREALIVEGYMDAIACHQFGFAQAVATLGTALTEEHARLLKRYVGRVILLFDTDAAGLRAARRAGETLMGTGLEIKVARLQGVKDPDELLRAQGAPALQAAIDNAVPLMEFCVDAGLAQARLAGGLTPQSRSAVLADTYPMLVKLGSAVEAEAELLKAAQTLGVSPEAAAEDYAAFKKGVRKPATVSPVQNAGGVEQAVAQALQRADGQAPEGLALTEGAILGLIQGSPELFRLTKEELPEPRFCTSLLQAAADLLWKTESGSAMEVEDDGSEAYQAAEGLLRELSFRYEPVGGDLKPAEYLRDLFHMRQERMLERESARLKLQLRIADGDASSTGLLKQIQNMDKEIYEMRRQRRERHLAQDEEEA